MTMLLFAFLLAAGSAQLCNAHTTFTNFYVDGNNQGDGVAVRMNDNPAQATFPIDSISKAEMACGESPAELLVICSVLIAERFWW